MIKLTRKERDPSRHRVTRLKGFSSNLSREAQQEFEALIHFLICCQIRYSGSWDLHMPFIFFFFFLISIWGSNAV